MAKEELPRGQLTNIILSTLLNEDKYGYEIIDDIRQKTNDSLIVKQPSLYSCLRRMEEQNLISSYWRDSEIGGRRHYYSITDYGKKYAEKWSVDLDEFINKKTVISNKPTTTDIDNEQNNTSNGNGTILQQSSLFNIKEPEKPNIETNHEQQKPQNFVQFDLFTTSPKVVEPSDEVFDCIKKLRDEANEDDTSINKNLIDLRNEQQPKEQTQQHTEEILTSYENSDYKINNQNQVKNAFWQFSKKQKSFAGNLQNNPTRFNDAPYQDEEEPTLQEQEDNLTNHSDNTQITNIKQEESSIMSSSSKQNTIVENSILQPGEQKPDYEEPIIHSTILYNETVEDNEPSADDSIQFIDLSGNNDFVTDDTKIDDKKSIIQDSNAKSEPSTSEKEKNHNDEVIESLNVNNQEKLFEPNKNELTNSPIEQQNLQTKKQLDDAVLITEHPTINIPKVKKIAPARFEHIKYENNNNIIDKKLEELRREQSQLSEDTTQSNTQNLVNKQDEFIPNNHTYDDNQEETKTDFKSLKSFYNKCNIKFGTYTKQKGLKQRNNKLLKTSIMSISVLLLVIIESAIMYAFNKESQPIWNFLYIVCPTIFIGFTIYNFICVTKKKKSILQTIKQYVWKFTTILSIVLLSILLLFSLNLIFGIELDNISTYITSFVYLSVMISNLVIIKILDIILP